MKIDKYDEFNYPSYAQYHIFYSKKESVIYLYEKI